MKNGDLFTNLRSFRPTKKAMVILLGFILTYSILFGILNFNTVAANGNLTVYAPETLTPPIIDGTISPGEWDDAEHYSFFFVPFSPHPPDDIDIFLLSDDNTLYIAYDVQPDNTTENFDYAYLAFDLNNNGTQDFLLYVARDFTISNDVRLKWENCSNLIWSIAFGFNTTPQETGRNHTIIEMKIGINQTDPYTTQTASDLTHLPFGISPVGVLFGGYGTLAPGWFYGNSSYIDYFINPDATMYADLYLKSPPSGIPGFEFLFLFFGFMGLIMLMIRKKIS
ncbi:MAG: hypothetical protein ACFFD2_04495 [Promethearchaeota archaeon]